MARGRIPGRAARIPVSLIALALVASACAGAEKPETPPEGSRAVSFPASDGVLLEGRLFGQGNGAALGVVLSHELPEDQSIWWDFAERLAENGYTAVTYNFRGYCPGGDAGCSEGERNVAAIWQDVLGAMTYLRSQGTERIALVGSSMGGTASIVAASQDGEGVEVVVTLSAPASIEGLTATPDMLASIPSAKLFLAGNGDATAAEAAQAFYDQASSPKQVQILPSDDHGTKLLYGNQSQNTRTYILTELEVHLKGTE